MLLTIMKEKQNNELSFPFPFLVKCYAIVSNFSVSLSILSVRF